ncbi:MAG: TonB-dependent siderophore receptor, partial [Balneolaceae bacterium]
PDPLADNQTIQRQIGIYLQDQLTFYEKLILTLNGRYDWALTETSDYLADAESEQDDNAFSGRAGLSYRTGIGLAPYLSYSQSFNPVIGTNQSGDQFDPERGQQYELGLKYEPQSSSSYVTIALFDLTRQDFLQTDPETLSQVQTGEANSQGIEIEGVTGFYPGLNVTASFTYQDVEITESANEEEVGHRPVQVRETMASLWADYTVQQGTLEGLGVSGGVRHMGPMYGNLPNTLEIPAATLADAAVFYDWDKFRLQVNVDNLFNNEYVASGFTSEGQNFGTYGAVRSLQASLRYRW